MLVDFSIQKRVQSCDFVEISAEIPFSFATFSLYSPPLLRSTISGTMEAPSGEGQDPLGFDVENREPSNVFKCSRCGQNISLVSAQGIERVTQIIQVHLEQCLRSRRSVALVLPFTFYNEHLITSLSVHYHVRTYSTQELSRLTTKNNIDPLELLMPLQPRRTWSAEDDRRRKLEADPDAYDVGPHSVTCRGCHRPIRLNATGRYYAANWNKHKMGCKIANNVDGGGPSSLVRVSSPPSSPAN